MKLHRKSKRLITKGLLLAVLGLSFAFAGALPIVTSSSALADTSTNSQTTSGTPQDCTNPPGTNVETQSQCQCQNNESQSLCGGNPQSTDTCNPSNPDYAKNRSSGLCSDIVNNYLNPIINFLGVGVGLIIVISVVVGGIQYAAAGDNPQGIEAAKNRIINSLIALVAFGLMYALLQWLVPGGIF